MIALAVLTLAAAGEPSDSGKAIQEYVAKLTAAEPTADAQFKLGSWARRQGMNDVADGHCRAAVFIDPSFAPAQKALGRRLHDGVWETVDERKSRMEREDAMHRERAEWLK